MDPGGNPECVTVNLQSTHEIPFHALVMAKSTAGAIFADVGIRIRWSESKSQPVSASCLALAVEFHSDVPETFRPGALAYSALRQEYGPQIHVFANRILKQAPTGLEGVILGHVLAHEIGHMLEGRDRHSDEGVMKAHWVARDYHQMAMRPYRFTPEDAEMIHLGYLRRREIAMQFVR
jgi:hypothetical protein